jgi:prepilin-type processing-associated H-X9-DG protein
MPDEPPPSPARLEYATPAPKRRTPFYLALAFAAVAIFAMVSNLTSTGRPRAVANRVKCASNLRQIGQAILIYSNDHNGQYPDDFQTLLLTTDITSECFVCPSSNDVLATGPTTQAIANNLTTGGHLSYMYLGKGMNTRTISADTVVAYEPLSNHGNDGSNVLFGDGHVEFLLAPAIKAMETAMKAKSGPVTLPSTP